MLDDAASAIIEGTVEIAGEFACDTVKRRWGWQGCLSVIILLASAIGLLLWWLGLFSN